MVAPSWYILVFIAIPCQAYLDDCVRLDRLWTGFSPTDHLQINRYNKLRAAQNTTNGETCPGDSTTQSSNHLSPLNSRDTNFRRYTLDSVSPSKESAEGFREDNQNGRSARHVQNYRPNRVDSRYKLDFNRQDRYSVARRAIGSDTRRVVSTTTRYRVRPERQMEERLTHSVDYRRDTDRRSEDRMDLRDVRRVRSIVLSADERNRRQVYERDSDQVRYNRNTRYQNEPEERKGVSDTGSERSAGDLSRRRVAGAQVTRRVRDTEYRSLVEHTDLPTESRNYNPRAARRVRTERVQAKSQERNRRAEIRTARDHRETNAFRSTTESRRNEATRMTTSRDARLVSEEGASVERRQTTQHRKFNTDERLILPARGSNARRFTSNRNTGGTMERNVGAMRESRLAESRSHKGGGTTERRDVRRTLVVGSFDGHRTRPQRVGRSNEEREESRRVDVIRASRLSSSSEERRETRVARYARTLPLSSEEYSTRSVASVRDERRVSSSNGRGATEHARRAASHRRELSRRDNRNAETPRVIDQVAESRGARVAEDRSNFRDSRSGKEEDQLVRRDTRNIETRHTYDRTIAVPRRSQYIANNDVAEHHSGNQRRTVLADRSVSPFTATSRRLSSSASQTRNKREAVFRSVRRDVLATQTPRSSNSELQRRVGGPDDFRHYRNREDDGISRLRMDARMRQSVRYQDASTRITTTTSTPSVVVDSRRVSQNRNHERAVDVRGQVRGTLQSEETRATSLVQDVRNTESRRHTPNEVRRLPEAELRIALQRDNAWNRENLRRETRHDGRTAIDGRLSRTLDGSQSILPSKDAATRRNIAVIKPSLAVHRSRGLDKVSRTSNERRIPNERSAHYRKGEDDVSIWDLRDQRHIYRTMESHDFPHLKKQATKYNVDWISSFYSSFTAESCMKTVVSVGAAAAILWSSMNPKAVIA